MAIYNTKYILTYCNKELIPLRIEIQQRDYTGESFILVNNQEYLQDNDGKFITVKRDSYDPNRDRNKISGSTNPFSLEYRNDKDGKLCTIMATSASLSFWADDNFNIDELKTSDETELKINFYYNDILEWTGFIVPDFFTEDIGTISELILTASDRIAILKDIDYTVPDSLDLNTNFMTIIHNCLKKTGLELGYDIILDTTCVEWSGTSVSGNPLTRTFVSERRFIESNKTKNCYDVLQSVLRTFNCRLVQRLGRWVIINKEQLEEANGTVIKLDSNANYVERVQFNQQPIYFGSILTGGQRTIIPVGSLTTYSLDLGDNQLYPLNRTLQKSGSVLIYPDNWSDGGTIGSFNYIMSDLLPFEYNSLGVIVSTYQDSNEWLINTTSYKRVEFFNGFEDVKGIKRNWKYLKSREFKIASKEGKRFDADITIRAIGKPNTFVNVMVTLTFDNLPDFMVSLGSDNKWYRIGKDDSFQNSNEWRLLQLKFDTPYEVDTLASEQEFKLTASAGFTTLESQTYDLTKAKMQVRIYPNTHDSNTAGFNAISVIKEVRVDFKLSDNMPKGVTYQSKLELGNFTKQYESQEVMFGDYQNVGQNGYFYQYRDDSLSIMYSADGTKTKNWDCINSNEYVPLLVQSTKQLAKAFGRANDELNISFDANYLDPIGSYSIGCFSERNIEVNDKLLTDNENNLITTRVMNRVNDKYYIISGGSIDYMRCESSVILSQKQLKDVQLIDYIYSNS